MFLNLASVLLRKVHVSYLWLHYGKLRAQLQITISQEMGHAC